MRIMLLAIGGLFLSLAVLADEPKKEEATLRELDLKGLARQPVRGSAEKPTAITTAEELAKAFPEEDIQTRLKKDVDFKKDQLLFFAWSGSGGDKVTGKLVKGDKGPEAVFSYQRGLTRDLRGHFRLFAIPKDATWRVEAK